MSTLIIRKKSLKTWLHTDSVLGDFIISKFYFNADNGNFQVVEQGQSRRVIYDVSDITLYDDTDGGSAETFANITALSLRLEALNYPAFQYDGQIVNIANLIEAGTNVTITGDGTEVSPYVISATGGGGGGAVDSVNSQTGVVSIDLQSVTDEGNETTNPLKVKLTGTRYSQLDYDGTRIYDDSSEANYLKDSATIMDIPSGKLITYSPTTGISYSKVADFSLLISEIGMSVFKNALNSGYFIGLDSDVPVLRLRNAGMIGTLTSENLFFDNVIFKMPSLKEEGEIRTLGAYVNGITAGLDGDIKNIIEKTSSFTAENYICYTANGTLTVTDPTPIANKGFIVHVIGGSVTIGGVAYTSGALVYRYYDGSSWISTNMNNAITIDATPTDGSANAVSSNGVFDALALKAPIAIRQGYTSLTGVTGVNVLASILIPANWLNDGESFKVEITNFKSVTVSSVNFAIYHDTVLNGVSNTISNGQQLTTTQRVGAVFYRLMTIDSTTLYNSVSSTAIQQLPAVSTATASATTFDRTANNYITVTSNPSVSSEVTGFYYLSVTKI